MNLTDFTTIIAQIQQIDTDCDPTLGCLMGTSKGGGSLWILLTIVGVATVLALLIIIKTRRK